MRLTRHDVTIASRVMLPADATFFTIVGVSFISTPLERLRATPGLAYLHGRADLRLVGVVFLFAGLVLIAAMVANHWERTKPVLAVMCCWMALFTLAMLGAAIFEDASWSAWAWPAYIATACWASSLSLESREI